MEYMQTIQTGFDELKPSLFELLSEEQLSSLLPPSLRYLLALATHRNPRYLLRILNSFDELYALLMLLVERHFLRTYGGSFTENFYGLKRERVLLTKNGEVSRAQLGAASDVRETLKLRDRDVWKNLAIMVGLPYLKRKLDEGYDVHAAHAAVLGPGYRERETLPRDATFAQRFIFYYKWFLRRIYPSVNAAYYFSLLAFNLAYLFDSSKYHSPFLWLIGTRIRRLGDADYKAIELATQAKPAGSSARPGQNSSIFNPRTMVTTVVPRLLSGFRILLPASIFALKFLEWWHASDFSRQLSRKAAEGLELPPPIISSLSRVSLSIQKAHSPQTASAPPKKQPIAAAASIPPPNPPISQTTLLPVFTVPFPVPSPSDPETNDSSLCPICMNPIVTPTASPTGFVYCYTCIHKWVEGTHERQEAFMLGDDGGEAGWGDGGTREGKWESGIGRDAVTGKSMLGGTGSLRRVVV